MRPEDGPGSAAPDVRDRIATVGVTIAGIALHSSRDPGRCEGAAIQDVHAFRAALPLDARSRIERHSRAVAGRRREPRRQAHDGPNLFAPASSYLPTGGPKNKPPDIMAPAVWQTGRIARDVGRHALLARARIPWDAGPL
jgi:hypothetical protein